MVMCPLAQSRLVMRECFHRSFVYTLGPAYGGLLDAVSKNWILRFGERTSRRPSKNGRQNVYANRGNDCWKWLE